MPTKRSGPYEYDQQAEGEVGPEMKLGDYVLIRMSSGLYHCGIVTRLYIKGFGAKVLDSSDNLFSVDHMPKHNLCHVINDQVRIVELKLRGLTK